MNSIADISKKDLTCCLVNLGCSKNLVDGERMLAELHKYGFIITDDLRKADVLILNTCGFLEASVRESIQNILMLAEFKATNSASLLVVVGCLIERYGEDLQQEMPEIDLVTGCNQEKHLPDLIAVLYEKKHGRGVNYVGDNHANTDARILLTPPHYAYLKIAEGCNNNCSYCCIPGIRGRQISVNSDELVLEAQWLLKRGVKEINIIAQDITNYQKDKQGDNQQALPELLERLDALHGDYWLRLLYANPFGINDQLLKTMQQSQHVLPYLDMPVQHAVDHILAKMNRNSTQAQLKQTIFRIREYLPKVALRSTLIVGFPGETDEDFTKLLDFIEEIQFDRLGAFIYSAEEGTAAANLPNRVPPEVAQARLGEIMKSQESISLRKNLHLKGETLTVIYEQDEAGTARKIGRSYRDAPDVDGVVFVRNYDGEIGEFGKVVITGALHHDLLGEAINK